MAVLRPLSLHRDSSGLWIDLTLARHLLDFLAAFLTLPLPPTVPDVPGPSVGRDGQESGSVGGVEYRRLTEVVPNVPPS